jgi:TRAP transporter 4TM/12TM fusion protein
VSDVQPASGLDAPLTDEAPDEPSGQPAWLTRSTTVAFFAVSLLFVVYLLRYYATGFGGPISLAVAMVPVAYIIATIDDLRRGRLYSRLGPAGSAAIGTIFVGLATAAGLYLNAEFDAIRFSRVGLWTTADLLAGATLIVLLLEYARRKYLPLFVLTVVLMLYVVYGNVVPGLFSHPGLSWRRVVTSMSLETTTGIFEGLPQLGLTLIGSFILVLAILRGFGAIDSLLKAASRLAVRSPHLLPQSVVIGSLGVASISGSGAANAATTGGVTIPALIRAGMSRVRAAAIETATSLGGQLLPPLMGIAAFLMANYLQVSYFEVMARGFAPAIIYFAGVSFAVYLVAARLSLGTTVPTDLGRLTVGDRVNLAGYLIAIVGLVYLMGVLRQPPMQAAQRVFVVLAIGLSLLFLVRVLRTPEGRRPAALVRPYAGFVETFARMTAELTVLLAILGLVTAAFTITGVPTKVGFVMLEMADINIAVMALAAFVFGYIVGMGLPPAPTYIIVAVVIAPFMIAAGVEPWVVHFFAFFIAVFGELSPPTSLTAAVASRIADASFMRTMFRALEMCIPLFVLMVAVFTWPGIVLEPGLDQIAPAAAVLTATFGITASIHGRFDGDRWIRLVWRLGLAAASLGLLAQPSAPVAIVLAVLILATSGNVWMRARRPRQPTEPSQTAPPSGPLESERR